VAAACCVGISERCFRRIWPESEGDKAVRNLYDATKDLRRVLVAMPGVQLRVTEQTYGLVLASSARVH